MGGGGVHCSGCCSLRSTVLTTCDKLTSTIKMMGARGEGCVSATHCETRSILCLVCLPPGAGCVQVESKPIASCSFDSPLLSPPPALVQELLHNKTQSASSRTRMLLMIRSSAVCLLNTIRTALNSSSGSSSSGAAGAAAGPDGLLGSGGAGGSGLDSPGGSSRRVHKVC